MTTSQGQIALAWQSSWLPGWGLTCVHMFQCTQLHSSHHLIYPLTARIVGAPQMSSQPVSSIFLCSPLPSGTWQTPGLSVPWCCLPPSSSVYLVFFLPFTVPCKMVLARPNERETCPYHCSLHLFTRLKKIWGSCTQGLYKHESLHWKVTLGEKSLAALESWFCISTAPELTLANWGTCLLFTCFELTIKMASQFFCNLSEWHNFQITNFFFFTSVLSHWDFSHGKFGLFSLGKASCNTVTLPNLRCMLSVLVFP